MYQIGTFFVKTAILNYTQSMNLNYFEKHHFSRSAGQKIADNVTSVVGSWRFIIIQSTILFAWIILNSTIGIMGYKWDAPPFILLNLMLSFQAAYTAPFIMMSQNRQSQIDRKHAEQDYQVNKLAEQEIELIQKQLNELTDHVKQNADQKKELKLIKSELKALTQLLSK
jgi:uncharacterized membrane protein